MDLSIKGQNITKNEPQKVEPKIMLPVKQEPNVDRSPFPPSTTIKTHEINIDIKKEPPDVDENEELCEDNAAYPVHMEYVKVEPLDYNNDDTKDLPKSGNESSENDSDDDSGEEYKPFKQTCSVKNGKITKNRKSSSAGSLEKEPKMDYSEDVLRLIEIYTQTEEEWLEERKQTLETRKHMDYVCTHCALGFVVSEAYNEHMKIHQPESGELECELCHARQRSALALHHHRLRHYRRYRCSACGALFRDKDSAASHAMRDHAGRAFPCRYCSRGFKRPRYLKRHIEQYHKRTQNIECPVCRRMFHEKDTFRCHMRTHNKEVQTKSAKIQTCPVCSREYKSRTSLKKHMLTHEENVQCDLCAEVPENRAALKKHYLRVHNQLYVNKSKEETCPYCFRSCVTGPMLKRHIKRMHSDRTKKYQCEHCQRLFMTKGEVRAHIVWSHLPARMRGGHPCSCGKLFRTPSLLAAHVSRRHKGHVPPRDHRCVHCGKAFMDKQVLNRHMRVHSEEMFPCLECGLEFKTKPYVEVHYKLRHLNMTREQIKEEKMMNGRRIRGNTNIQSTGDMGTAESLPTNVRKVNMQEQKKENVSKGKLEGSNAGLVLKENEKMEEIPFCNVVKIEPTDNYLYPMHTSPEVH